MFPDLVSGVVASTPAVAIGAKALYDAGSAYMDSITPASFKEDLTGTVDDIYGYLDILNPFSMERRMQNRELSALYDRAFEQSLSSARDAMHYESQEAQRNRDFQKMMSDTQYQRAVSDMIKAGLNPINAIGSPASTPSGSMGSGHSSARDVGTYNMSSPIQSLIDLVAGAFSNATGSAKDISGIATDVVSIALALSPFP